MPDDWIIDSFFFFSSSLLVVDFVSFALSPTKTETKLSNLLDIFHRILACHKSIGKQALNLLRLDVMINSRFHWSIRFSSRCQGSTM